MPKLRSYRGLRGLITGASSGIGRTLALRIAAEGASVALVARREDELEKLATEIRGVGGEALVLTCDVAERAQVEVCAARALEKFGGIDLLVNNAGYGHHRTFLEWDLSDMERLMRVNYFGTLYFTKALLPQMVERRKGWLVFVSSVAGKIASPEEAAYAASKFAMEGLASALSIEVEGAGIHVLTVRPGVIRTPFFDDEALERMPPVSKRQFVDPERLVDAIVTSLARGKRELTFPRWIASGYLAQALAPEFTRRQIRRNTIDAVARERARAGKRAT
ncbi:MAG: SDR family NAD(P)-dependent oxidoreductase [Myxococcota bacterium]